MRIIELDHHKVNLTFITDLHVSGFPPGRRRDNYKQAIIDKINYAAELTSKVRGAGLCGGDVFHIKRWKSPANSPEVINDTMEVFSKFPTGCIYGIIGNHDFDHNIDTIMNSPLGILITSGVYTPLNTEPTRFTTANKEVSVDVFGFDYKNSEETLRALEVFKSGSSPNGKSEYSIALIHQMGHPGKDGNFFGETSIGYDSLSGCGFDVVLWGHDHSRIEPKTVDGTIHLHFGSLSRASLSSDEVDRPVVIPVISFSSEGIKIVEKEIEVAPLEIAFSTSDKIVKNADKSEDIKSFLEEMDEQVSEVESDDPKEILDQICPDKDIKSIVIDYCEI